MIHTCTMLRSLRRSTEAADAKVPVFFLSTPGVALAGQPQRHDTTAKIEGEVGGIVFHIGLLGTCKHSGIRVHIVLLLCRVPLNVEDHAPARFQLLGAPLFLIVAGNVTDYFDLGPDIFTKPE
jgi:hypothetical protein